MHTENYLTRTNKIGHQTWSAGRGCFKLKAERRRHKTNKKFSSRVNTIGLDIHKPLGVGTAAVSYPVSQICSFWFFHKLSFQSIL